MNNSVKNIIFFIGGAATGAFGGVVATKEYYKKQYSQMADETISEMKDLMKKQYIKPSSVEIANDIPENVALSEDDSKNATRGSRMAQKESLSSDEIKRRLDENRARTDYAAVYGKVHPDNGKKTKVDLNTFRDIEIEDEEEDSDESEPDVVEFHNKNRGRKPRLISASKVADLPEGVEIVGLQFYTSDEVLCDDNNEEIISDHYSVVGDCLTKYDFTHSNERVIYVMNYEHDTCYEIVKVDASYEETH